MVVNLQNNGLFSDFINYIYANGSGVNYTLSVGSYLLSGGSSSYLLHFSCNPGGVYNIYVYYIQTQSGLPEYSYFQVKYPTILSLAYSSIIINVSNPYSFNMPAFQLPVVFNLLANNLSTYLDPNGQNIYFQYQNGSIAYSWFEGEYLAPQAYPTGVAFSPDSKLIYGSEEQLNKIAVINATSFSIVKVYNVSGNPFGIAATNKYIFFNAYGNSSLDIINLSNGQVKTIGSLSAGNEGISPSGLFLHNGLVYSVSDDYNAVYVYNATSLQYLKAYSPYRPWTFATANDTPFGFTDSLINTCFLQAINLTSGSIQSIDCRGLASKGVAANNNGEVITTDISIGNITVFNSTSLKVIKDIFVGPDPNYVVANDQYAFVTLGNGEVAIVNLNTLSVQGYVYVGPQPSMLAISPNNKILAVAVKGGSKVAIINLSNFQLAKEIPLVNFTTDELVFWIAMPPLPAHSYYVLKANLIPKTISAFNGVQIGEASQLSPTFGEYDNIASIFPKGLLYNFYIDFQSGFTYPSQVALDSASLQQGSKFTQPGISTYEVAYSPPFVSAYYGSPNFAYGALGKSIVPNVIFDFEYWENNSAYTFCNATNPWPCPPFHAEGGQAANFSWTLKAIGFAYSNSSTLFESDTDDCLGVGIFYSSNTTYLNGSKWLGPINPNNVLNSWGGNSGTNYVGYFPAGDYPFEYDFCEGTGAALATLWSQQRVYYYHPTFLNESPIVKISNLP
jgi:DNA-binding beta-propeller fold protein YncE